MDPRVNPACSSKYNQVCSGKRPFDMVVVDDAGQLARLVEDDGEVDLVRRVSRVRIRRPFEVAERPAIRAVMASVVLPGRTSRG